MLVQVRVSLVFHNGCSFLMRSTVAVVLTLATRWSILVGVGMVIIMYNGIKPAKTFVIIKCIII